MANAEFLPEWEEFPTGQITLYLGMDVTMPGDDVNPSVRIIPTREDEIGGLHATGYVDFEGLGISAPEEDSLRYLYFGPDDRKLRVGKPIDIEKYEVDAPYKGSNRKYCIIGAVAATAVTGLIVRKRRKSD